MQFSHFGIELYHFSIKICLCSILASCRETQGDGGGNKTQVDFSESSFLPLKEIHVHLVLVWKLWRLKFSFYPQNRYNKEHFPIHHKCASALTQKDHASSVRAVHSPWLVQLLVKTENRSQLASILVRLFVILQRP